MLSFCISLSRFFRLPLTLASFSTLLALGACADRPTEAPLTPTAPSRTAYAWPVMSLSPSDTLRFGSLPVGSFSDERGVKVTNTGTADLQLLGYQIKPYGEFWFAAATDSSCYVVPNGLLAPGTSCYFLIGYSPITLGAQQATLEITHNSGTGMTYYPITGTGTPAGPLLQITPQEVIFDDQLVGTTSAAQQVTIANAGVSDLYINALSFTGANASDYAVSTSGNGSCQINVPVEPSTACVIDVAFKPTAVGNRTATLKIATSTGDDGAAFFYGVGYQTADVAVSLDAATQPGRTVAYTITTKNNGPGLATGIALTDSLPTGATFVSLAAPAGVSCITPATGATGRVTCSVSSLANGDARTIQLVVKPASGVKSITNKVAAKSTSIDPTSSNDVASVTTTLTGKK